MNATNRLLITLSLLSLFAATPFIIGNDKTTTTSAFKIDMSYEKITSEQDLVHVPHFAQVEQGSFFLQKEGKSGYLLTPTIDTDVAINVTGLIARTRVTQTFTNPTKDWVNGVYAFPLPENSAVDQLVMTIGERKIAGQIQAKQKAKKMYQRAKNQGKKASLLEQNRPNLFTNFVANIGPKESISVTIEYQQIIHYDNGQFSLRFPTTITHRYLPAKTINSAPLATANNGWQLTQPNFTDDQLNDDQLNDDNEPASPMHKVAMNIQLNTGFELANITSERHPIIQHETAKGQYHISLEQNMIANQDFLLHWQAAANNQVSAAHFSQQTDAGHYGIVMLMPPALKQQTTFNREVIFIIDTSGSMAGSAIKQAKTALTLAVKNLKATDNFNIVAFNTNARKMALSSIAATANNKKSAFKFIKQLTADGGTEMLSALQLALGHQTIESEKLRQVIFITDGAVGNETMLFNYIEKNLQQSRLFTVGIGSAPNSYFMTEAAQIGKGTFTYVNSSENINLAMDRLFTKLSQPVLADLVIDIPEDVEIYPRSLPDLYLGEPLMISYYANKPIQQLSVQGDIQQNTWRQTLQLTKSKAHAGLDKLWARRKIAQLERDKYLGENEKEINQTILSVAMTHHLVSSMTSLIAIDIEPAATHRSVDKQVKNHRPKGQLQGTLPQTATPAFLHLLIGTLILVMVLLFSYLTKSKTKRRRHEVRCS